MKFRFFSADTKPRIGLALSGGGARGFAHAGALKAMEEAGIKPDIIAGVSAGSVIAVMYAAGIKPEKISELFTHRGFRDFCQLCVPKNGFFRMDGFKKFLRDVIPYQNIEDLPIPTIVCATDIDSGSPVAFDHGPIAERVAASCSIPIIFQPIKIEGKNYVDGGVVHNLPAWAIRDKCKYLLGVNCSPMVKSDFKNSLIDIAQRSYNIMAKSNVYSDMRMCDLVIETTEIADYKVFNLRGRRRVYLSGYEAAIDTLRNAGFRLPLTEISQ